MWWIVRILILAAFFAIGLLSSRWFARRFGGNENYYLIAYFLVVYGLVWVASERVIKHFHRRIARDLKHADPDAADEFLEDIDDDARDQIAREIARQVGTCDACGYDLRASVDRCPECGWEIPHPRPLRDR